MKTIPLCLILVFVLGQFVAAQTDSKVLRSIADTNAKILTFQDKELYSTNYDKFEDKSHVLLRGFDLLWKNKELSNYGLFSFHLTLMALYDGDGVKSKPDAGALCLNTSSHDWMFLKNNDLILLVDDVKLGLGKTSHDGKVNSSSSPSRYSSGVTVSESGCWVITAEQVASILVAKKIEFKYGYVQGEIRQEKFYLLKQMKSLLE